MESDDDDDDDDEFPWFELAPDVDDDLSILTALIGMKAVRGHGLPPHMARQAVDNGFLRELVILAFGNTSGELDDDEIE